MLAKNVNKVHHLTVYPKMLIKNVNAPFLLIKREGCLYVAINQEHPHYYTILSIFIKTRNDFAYFLIKSQKSSKFSLF